MARPLRFVALWLGVTIGLTVAGVGSFRASSLAQTPGWETLYEEPTFYGGGVEVDFRSGIFARFGGSRYKKIGERALSLEEDAELRGEWGALRAGYRPGVAGELDFFEDNVGLRRFTQSAEAAGYFAFAAGFCDTLNGDARTIFVTAPLLRHWVQT